MSFRSRLTFFFVLIVVIPMTALAILVSQISSESRTAKTDARLSAGLHTALGIYRDEVQDAQQAVRDPMLDQALADALPSADTAAAQSAAADALRRHAISGLAVRDAQGHEVAVAGKPSQIATVTVKLSDSHGEFGSVTASASDPSEFTSRVADLTGEDAALVSAGGSISAATTGLRDVSLPAGGDSADIDANGQSLRAAASDLPGTSGVDLVLLGPQEGGGFFISSPLAAVGLVAFLGAALLFVAMLVRTLHGQTTAMLSAARRIGGGEFDQRVPVVGQDEMAELASEFNKMSVRLTEQMDELRRQRDELERSVRRIGDAFGAGLDRPALLQIVVETAIGACEADYGRIVLSGVHGQTVDVGKGPSSNMHEVLREAEGDAVRNGEMAKASRGETHVMASPLARMSGGKGSPGLMSVGRRGLPFSAGEQEVFRYLIGQASTSIENIALHELVSQQAVTDALTGLANNRSFRDLASKEAARAQRFGHSLSLVMLDIDDFKRVNDTYGHLQGDALLKAVGRVLDEESRGVDEPARYGGEEFVVVLPETDLAGAVDAAERIRSRVEAKEVPPARDGGASLRVTVSLGAAAMPGCADGLEELIAAADAALYEAKRRGKNQVVSAPSHARTRPDGSGFAQ